METNRKLLVGARGVFEHGVPNCCRHQLNYWCLTLESLLLIVFSCFLVRFLLYVQSLNTFLILFSKDTSIIEMFSFLQYVAYTAKANDSITRFRLQDIVFALSTLTKATDTNAVSLLVTDRVCESCRGFLQL